MARRAFLVLSLVAASAAWAGEVAFTSKLRARRRRGRVSISFAVSDPTDIEVSVLDSKERVVRHLAAGLLEGEKAPPAPLKPGLKQTLQWDMKNDFGRPARDGPFKVRVALGSTPRLDKVIGWNGSNLAAQVVGIAVGKQGELFVLDSEGSRGRSTLRVFDNAGKYLRTLIPYAANVPRERTAPTGHLEIDGERLPIVFNGHGGNLLPLTSGMKFQKMILHPKGFLLLAGAVGTICEHGPPRHLLAFHPEGGAPKETGFVGPLIRAPRGFMGGSGEGYHRFFDHLALSPDGEWIYLNSCKMTDKKPHHSVFRLKWTDEKIGEPFLGERGVPGSDDAHFDDPQGLAVDKDGNLYVCDRGNDRVMKFSAEGRLLGRFSVEKPDLIEVHPKSGEIYLLSRDRDEKRRDRWSGTTTLLKFSAFKDAAPKELARLEGRNIQLVALEPIAQPARLWLVLYTGWGKPQQVCPVTDKGGQLVLGPPVNNSEGLGYPLFIAADPRRNRVLIREWYGGKVTGIRALDLVSGKVTVLPIKGADFVLDRDGNIYVLDGYNTNSMSRYTPEGKPLPFPGTDSNKIQTGNYRAYGPDLGLRGHCIGPNGDIYLVRSNNSGYGGVGDNDGTCGRVDIFGPDGQLKRPAVINGLGVGDCGLDVDLQGNIYVGMNIKPLDRPLPEHFSDKVPAKDWVWWRRGKREAPWCYPYYNTYLFHIGMAVKFGPEGGKVYGFGGRQAKPKDGKPPALSPLVSAENAPASATTFKSGYLKRTIKVEGAKWFRQGMSVIPTSDLNWGDPACVCLTSRLDVDEFGRVFVPDVFRFSVQMLDSEGNEIARIGRYGNADSAGPKSAVPEPEIAFAWAPFVSATGGRLYVSDSLNQRVVIVRFDHAAVAERILP